MAIYHIMLNYVVVFTFACIASVLCQYYPWLTTPKPKGPFELRLVDGPSKAEGRLEVLINNTWGTVCDDSFSTFHGDLACKQLGYDGALYVNKSAAYGPGDGPTWIYSFYCPKGTESSLWQCRYELSINKEYPADHYYCSSHGHDVGVSCFHLKDGEIPVRLYDHVDNYRKLHNAGTIELFYNGSWSFICSHGRSRAKWGLKEADVVCKELNFKRATSVTFNDRFYVPKPRKFVISSVQCRGNEDKIADCDITATDRSNYCREDAYSQDAAVVVCSKTEGDLSSGKIGGIVMICIISIIMFITIPVLIFITRKRKQAPEQGNPQEVTPVMHSGAQPYQDIS